MRKPRTGSKSRRLRMTRPSRCSSAVGRDQSVEQPYAARSPDPARAFRDRPVDGELTKWREQRRDQRGRAAAGEQLRSRHHRVVQPVTADATLCGAAQVVDEDVAVQQQVTHATTRRDRERSHRPRRRR